MPSSLSVLLAARLQPTPAQYTAIKDTMQAVNRGADVLSRLIFQQGAGQTGNRAALMALYKPAVLAEAQIGYTHFRCAIEKATEAHDRYRGAPARFDPLSAIPSHKRDMLSWRDANSVSIRTLAGRLAVPAVFSHYEANRFQRKANESILALVDETLWILSGLEYPDPPQARGRGLPIDFGLIEPDVPRRPAETLTPPQRQKSRRLFPHLAERDPARGHFRLGRATAAADGHANAAYA